MHFNWFFILHNVFKAIALSIRRTTSASLLYLGWGIMKVSYLNSVNLSPQSLTRLRLAKLNIFSTKLSGVWNYTYSIAESGVELSLYDRSQDVKMNIINKKDKNWHLNKSYKQDTSWATAYSYMSMSLKWVSFPNLGKQFTQLQSHKELLVWCA